MCEEIVNESDLIPEMERFRDWLLRDSLIDF